MTEKRKRRWFQFSLRALLVFVLLVSIGMSWVGVKLQRAREQRAAVEVIIDAGGSVSYEPFADSSVPQRIRALFSDDFFFVDVLGIVVDTTDFGDDEAVCLKELADLQWLILSETQVTDAGLEHLKRLTNLKSLWLRDTRVTAAGLEHLEAMRQVPRNSLPSMGVLMYSPRTLVFPRFPKSQGGDDERTDGTANWHHQGCRRKANGSKEKGLSGAGDRGLPR